MEITRKQYQDEVKEFWSNKCEQLRTENERLNKAIDIARGFISKEGDCVEQSVRKEFEQALKGITDGKGKG